MPADSLLLRNVQLRAGAPATDVLIREGTIVAVERLEAFTGPEVDGGGAALLPGLHDHHIHLFATAAAAESVQCGPPEVHTRDQLVAALTSAPGTDWIRGVGYDESVAGPLDRRTLDELLAALPERPVRIQHRGGSLWSLNSVGLDALGLADAHPDGLLWRADELLRERLGHDSPPALATLGAQLASYGITGVTDTTPGDASAVVETATAMPQRLTTLDTSKIVVSDHSLPGLDELVERIGAVHASGRPAAVHSVTRESLLLILAAFAEAGARTGDRIEHAAVCPPEALEQIVRLGLTVVTQPSLVAMRGDDYLADVDPRDIPYLWRYRTLLDAGVPVGLSSDAPYGDPDPWRTIRAARDRTSPSGQVVGAHERVDPATALCGFLTHAQAPGGPVRTVAPGVPADLVLLDAPLSEILGDPRSDHVRLTLVAGRAVYEREERRD